MVNFDLKCCYEIESHNFNKLVEEVPRQNIILFLNKGNHTNISNNPDIVHDTIA